MVEPRSMNARTGYSWVGQRLHMGLTAHMQSEGRFYAVRKSFITVGIHIDCNKVPTYRIGSSEDHTGCCSGHIQPRGWLWLGRYPVWSNEPSV